MQMCNNGKKKKCKVKFNLGTCCESGWKLFMNNLSLTKEKASFGLFFFFWKQPKLKYKFLAQLLNKLSSNIIMCS